MKLKLILAPPAGRGRSEKIWPEVQKLLDENKIIYDLEITKSQGHATQIAKNAAEENFDTIVAIGGDGTANEVANGVFGSSANFGIIPCGEGNDFANSMGLSFKNIPEAVKVILDGHVKTIDIGMVNDRYFVEVVGVGIDGEINEGIQNSNKLFHGFALYLINAIIGVFSYKPKKVKIRIDGTTIESKLLLISVGNGITSGGGFKLTPEAKYDDGLLDVCFAEYPGKIKSLFALPKAISGNHCNLSFIAMFRGKEIEISSDDLLVGHVDGEILKGRDFSIKILPKQLKVLAKI